MSKLINPFLHGIYALAIVGGCHFYKAYKSMRQMESNTPKEYGMYLRQKRSKKWN